MRALALALAALALAGCDLADPESAGPRESPGTRTPVVSCLAPGLRGIGSCDSSCDVAADCEAECEEARRERGAPRQSPWRLTGARCTRFELSECGALFDQTVCACELEGGGFHTLLRETSTGCVRPSRDGSCLYETSESPACEPGTDDAACLDACSAYLSRVAADLGRELPFTVSRMECEAGGCACELEGPAGCVLVDGPPFAHDCALPLEQAIAAGGCD